jgi:hypothetical protein
MLLSKLTFPYEKLYGSRVSRRNNQGKANLQLVVHYKEFSQER